MFVAFLISSAEPNVSGGTEMSDNYKFYTQKMADLMQELKDYVAKNDQGVMSIDAIKKVDQIEKLAHSLKGKMKQSF